MGSFKWENGHGVEDVDPSRRLFKMEAGNAQARAATSGPLAEMPPPEMIAQANAEAAAVIAQFDAAQEQHAQLIGNWHGPDREAEFECRVAEEQARKVGDARLFVVSPLAWAIKKT
jgi:hypothetical protein